MASLGRIETDSPPLSNAPMTDPGFRQYSSSAPGAGSTVSDRSILVRLSRCATESFTGSLRVYS